MQKKAVLIWIIALLLLAACGGGSEPEAPAPTAESDTSSSSTTESVENVTEEDTPVPAEGEEMEAEPTTAGDEVMEEEPADNAEEETAVEEAAPASPFGDRPLSGTDPESGLIINPDSVNPGDTFIVRGEIISMNLTPTTSPEFLILSPDGLKFRLRTQDLADTFFEDGEQLQAFQYQLGLLAQATATLPADAGPSDIPTSTDFVLVKSE